MRDLVGNLLPGYDFIADPFVSNDNTARDADAADPGDAVGASYCGAGTPARNSSWHGTHVAGIVGAVAGNGSGVVGVAFGARSSRCVRSAAAAATSDIADAIVWAAGGTVTSAGECDAGTRDQPVARRCRQLRHDDAERHQPGPR